MKNIFTLLVTLLVSQSLWANVETDTAVDPAKLKPVPLNPMPIHSTTTQNIVDALALRHFVETDLDDNLSSKILDTYISDLDPSKSYFLASDIKEFEAYRFKLDEALRRGDLSPAFSIFNRYHQRVIKRFEKVIAKLEVGVDQFDFTKPEELLIDREAIPWPQSASELDELWRKRIKDSVLNLKLTDKEPEKIQELLVKRFANRLTRAKQTNSEDVYQLYMNSFTKIYDPHTQYFSPRTSENFNINMSLSLEGIGAVLQIEDEFTKVVSLVPAGPADKAGALKPDDKIIAVGQGIKGDMVDVIGWRLDEVVQLIRGPKDTVVRLDIVAASSSDGAGSRVINITRNKVELEEQSAKSEILELEQFGAVRKIGVIDIPTFYVDFKAIQKGDRNFKSTTRDVKKLIQDLVTQGVDGIVIDLRDNGGGSLQEAKLLTGLFIDRGPTVQIRNKRNLVDVLYDKDITVVYDGPLAVLVNRLSASASEIFAGAMQDYERGVVLGSQTFGKGTVQSLLPLNRGQLKLTQAKFYRISGESTQEKGIIPDILYPSSYDPESIGESTLDQPLPWDTILPAPYRRKSAINQLVPQLRSLHDQRVSTNPEYNYLKEAFAYRKSRSELISISLNEAERIADKQEREDFWLALENKKRVALGQDALASLDELNEEELTLAAIETTPTNGAAIVTDGEAGDTPVPGSEMAIADLPSVETPVTGSKPDDTADTDDTPDPYLIESGHILLDLITLGEQTAAKQRSSLGS
jgi:carboxyl-terminal processing protease